MFEKVEMISNIMAYEYLKVNNQRFGWDEDIVEFQVISMRKGSPLYPSTSDIITIECEYIENNFTRIKYVEKYMSKMINWYREQKLNTILDESN